MKPTRRALADRRATGADAAPGNLSSVRLWSCPEAADRFLRQAREIEDGGRIQQAHDQWNVRNAGKKEDSEIDTLRHVVPRRNDSFERLVGKTLPREPGKGLLKRLRRGPEPRKLLARAVGFRL